MGIDRRGMVRSTESLDVTSQWLTKSSATIWDIDEGDTLRVKTRMVFINEHAACSVLKVGKKTDESAK